MTDLVIGKLAVGDKVAFLGEKQRYTVRAVSTDNRWAVCNKPFNARRTFIYSVVDLVEQLRGVDNYSGLGYETVAACERACAMFETGEAEFSHRRPPIPLHIEAERSVIRSLIEVAP